MCNLEIRNEAKRHGVKLWQIAERASIQDYNFSRKLRRELPEEEKKMFIAIIADIAAEAAHHAE